MGGEETERAHVEDLVIPFERERPLALPDERLSLLLQKPETLHIHEVLEWARRVFLLDSNLGQAHQLRLLTSMYVADAPEDNAPL